MSQSWINRLERKFGRFAVHGLARYIVAIELIGAFLGVFAPRLYFEFLALDFKAITSGQIWRLFTFVFYPSIQSIGLINILFLAIEVYLHYFIGTMLENMWGSFRFTLYYASGLLLSILGALIMYLFVGTTFWPAGFDYINESLFLAYATLFPNQEFYLYFVIPIKAKWFAFIYVAIIGYEVITNLSSGSLLGVLYAVAIVISMLNFLIFFISTRKISKESVSQHRTRRKFKKNMQTAQVVPIYRHRCAICGRTERDGDDIEFRFCSKCDGNYEYCDQHIFTHEHVKKQI